MAIRVLVVDDSRFFRRRIADILQADSNLQVIDFAENGEEAIRKVAQLKPDVVTMDVEMPVMDGITAVRHIMRRTPTPILMFSSLTTDGAKSTLDALDAGALDFLPKRFEDISRDKEEAKVLLRKRVIEIARKSHVGRSASPITSAAASAAQTRPVSSTPQQARPASSPQVSPWAGKSKGLANFKLVAIGTSTGGPVALQTVLTSLPANFPLPILLIQHMPGTFTPAFAQRLNQICAISVREAKDGDVLQPGLALLAPGGKQMRLMKRGASFCVKIEESDPKENYKPSVDITFTSVTEAAGGHALAIVLTGMGSDGREGARHLKHAGGTVWAQDEASSVVYGMPFAVADAGLTDKILPLSEIGPALSQGI